MNNKKCITNIYIFLILKRIVAQLFNRYKLFGEKSLSPSTALKQL